ncbi:MAG: acyloxyacyl hydrolase [Bacteroidota bacterium]
MLLTRWITLIGLCCWSFALNGQSIQDWRISNMVEWGRIIRHTPKFGPPINGKTWVNELTFFRQTTGSQRWEAEHNFPEHGFTFQFNDFGDPEVFGQAYALHTHFGYNFLRKGPFNMHFRLGFGLAYITKPFDPVTNRINNVIGSHFNAIVKFRMGMRYRISKRLRLELSGAFTHLSNGSTTKPNLGYNTGTLGLGVIYQPKADDRSTYNEWQPYPKVHRKIRFNTELHLGYKEAQAPNGPLLPSYSLVVTANRMLNQVQRFHLGFELEYNTATLAFLDQVEPFEENSGNRRQALRFSITANDEILIGKFSINFVLGAYLSNSFGQEYWLYTKLGCRYYPMLQSKYNRRLYMGIYLKAHQATADHISYSLGWAF